MPDRIDDNIKTIIDKLSQQDKDDIYRYLWKDYIKKDIEDYLEERCDDITLTDDLIDYAADLYVYEGEYDCNFDYWTNIEHVCELAYQTL